MTENEASFVSETTFDNIPEFQRIHNADGSFSLKSKKYEQLIVLGNSANFNLPRPGQELASKFNNKSFPAEVNTRRKQDGNDIIEGLSFGQMSDHDVKEKIKFETVLNNSFNFFGSPSQLRFYVLKKNLVPAKSYFLLAEESDLPKSANGTHYRPIKTIRGLQLHKQRARFEKLLEVHNLELVDGGNFVLDDKVNNKRFCDFFIRNSHWENKIFGNSINK